MDMGLPTTGHGHTQKWPALSGWERSAAPQWRDDSQSPLVRAETGTGRIFCSRPAAVGSPSPRDVVMNVFTVLYMHCVLIVSIPLSNSPWSPTHSNLSCHTLFLPVECWLVPGCGEFRNAGVMPCRRTASQHRTLPPAPVVFAHILL